MTSRSHPPHSAEHKADVRLQAERAAVASGDELAILLHHKSPEVVLALIENPNLLELQKIRLLRRRDLPPRFFERVAGSKPWMEEYAIRLAIARNPKTPQYVFTAILGRFLVLDLVKVASDPYVHADRKAYITHILVQRLPAVPLGTKINLAKKAGPELAEALLMDDPPEQLVRAVLPSRFLTERAIVKAVGASIRTEASLALIAAHVEWGKRHAVQLALAKNPALAAGYRLKLLAKLSRYDLHEILSDCAGHAHIVRAVEEELSKRPSDGRATGAKPLTSEEIQKVLAETKKRHPPKKKKSASEIRGAILKNEESGPA